jgi:hypothetical protein
MRPVDADYVDVVVTVAQPHNTVDGATPVLRSASRWPPPGVNASLSFSRDPAQLSHVYSYGLKPPRAGGLRRSASASSTCGTPIHPAPSVNASPIAGL